MKFEKLLQVYWAKGFFVGGESVEFDIPVKLFSNAFPGTSKFTFFKIAKRLEFGEELKKNPLLSEFHPIDLYSINIFWAQATSVNRQILELEKKATSRYYLIKTYRGRCQALGKPSRGQRTWSNANTAYRINNHIKAYISHFRKTHIKVEVVKKINFKVVERKFKHKAPKFIKKAERKPITIWL